MNITLACRHLFVFLFALAALALAGCTTPTSTDDSQDLSQPSADALRYEHLASLTSDPGERAVYQYMAALSWHTEGFMDRAYFLLRNLAPDFLSHEQRLIRQLTLAEYYRERGELALALDLLEADWIQADLRYADNELKSRWAGETARLSLLLGDYQRAFRVYDFALSYAEGDELEQYRKGLWKTLTLIDQLPGSPYSSTETRGWVALARINNQSSGRVADQFLDYLLWQDSFYNHPARSNPPESFALLEEIASGERPRVAILLPLSGDLSAVGKAILDGYMAARASSYPANERNPSDPLAPADIEIFDTQAATLTRIVRDLEDGDFDLVIGPLDRERVATYAEIMPDIPTLALNSLPEGESHREKPLLGLSLNVEPEAVQAAVRALNQGHQSALVLIPDTEWGDRAGTAFSDFWLAEGGTLSAYARYGDSTTHAALLESKLHVDQSVARKNRLQANLGRALEFTPRRRQDIDALFLAASPQQARQLKPMLAFFFAEDLPVYATSSIYSGFPDPKADRDLDGIEFSTMPWILDQQNALRAQIVAQTSPSPTALRMQALGVDSFYLSQRLVQFLYAPDTVYRGVLGKLSPDSRSNDLDRKQIWAEFRGGLAKPISN